MINNLLIHSPRPGLFIWAHQPIILTERKDFRCPSICCPLHLSIGWLLLRLGVHVLGAETLYIYYSFLLLLIYCRSSRRGTWRTGSISSCHSDKWHKLGQIQCRTIRQYWCSFKRSSVSNISCTLLWPQPSQSTISCGLIGYPCFCVYALPCSVKKQTFELHNTMSCIKQGIMNGQKKVYRNNTFLFS